jgi:hypothetical protein
MTAGVLAADSGSSHGEVISMTSKGLLMMLSLLALACFGSCGDIDDYDERYEQAMRSGFSKIPQAREIEKLFGEANHFISYFDMVGVGQAWRTTDVFIAGRYKLEMGVDVRMDEQFTKIVEVIGEPKFYLREIERVKFYGEQVGAAFGEQFTFGPEEWAKVVEAKGDFSVIGIHLDLDNPVKNIERYIEGNQ